jgi:hypothetical protein
MKRIALTLTACLIALPAAAQDATPQEPPEDSQPLLPFLEQFGQDMMRQFQEEIAPDLERMMEKMGPEMERLMAEILPRLQELGDTLGGLTQYELPEILPNGDIIIRRKKDAPPLPEDFDPNNPPIEL